MKKTVIIGKYEFEIDNPNSVIDEKFECLQNNGRVEIRFLFNFGKDVSPKKIIISHQTQRYGCAYVWSSSSGLKRNLLPDWIGAKIQSRSVVGTPILSFAGFNDENIITLSLSDAETPSTISGGYSEQTGGINFKIELFSGVVGVMNSYGVSLIIDERPLPFYECVKQASADFERKLPVRGIVNSAKQPVYSTWYSNHQDLKREELLADCKKAKSLGMDTVIIDDGWQTDDKSYGYGFCGDYYPSAKKVGEMSSLVGELHSIGMKVMLWYSVAFLGEFSEAFPKFKDKTLRYNEKLHCYVLDPRFKEVREFIADFLCRSAKEWGIDGLKLDFIDSFVLPENLTEREGIDCNTLEEGISKLLDNIKAVFEGISPDFMVEFRQSYIGPCMRKLASMFRVNDCPGDMVANRVGIADLKFTSGGIPVHSDPIMFPIDAEKEYIGTLFANSMFGVIQFSVSPVKLNTEQLETVKFWLEFLRENKSTLIDGEFRVCGGVNAYTECSASGNQNVIIAYFVQNHVVKIDSAQTTVVNASGVKGGFISAERERAYKIVDCSGNVIKSGHLNGLKYFDIPVGGMIKING